MRNAKALGLALSVCWFAGCTTTEPVAEPAKKPDLAKKVPMSSDDEGEPLSMADVPIDGPTMAELSFGEELPKAEAPWQKTLLADVEDIEKKAERFIESGSSLYDVLLSSETESEQARNAQTIETGAQSSLGTYRALVASVTRLQNDLKRPDVKAALPIAGLEAEELYAEVTKLLNRFAAAQSAQRPARYALRDRGNVVQFIFAEKPEVEGPSLAELPKAQREALQLLDRLKELSSEITFVSTTVSAWVYTGGAATNAAH